MNNDNVTVLFGNGIEGVVKIPCLFSIYFIISFWMIMYFFY